MTRPTSILWSSLLHACVVAIAIGTWHAATRAREPNPARLVFVPTEASPPPAELRAPDERVDVEPVTTELPDPPDPSEPPAQPFDPPPVRTVVAMPPPAPEPRDPLARVVPLPEPTPEPRIDEPSPPSATQASSFVEARALDAQNHAPSYPPLALRRGWAGVVLLELSIAADGSVTEVELLQSSGHDILDRAARTAAVAWHFQPAHQDGVAVASRLRLPVEFRIVDG